MSRTAQDDSLNGQVVVVTGSSSGIGAAIARRGAQLGATVVVNSSRSVEAGEALAAELHGASYCQAEVGSEEGRERLIRYTLEEHGRLDHLVNNAARTQVIPHAELERLTTEVWRDIFELNLFATYQMTLLALPHLRRSGRGSVLNITSLAGIRQLGSSIPYAVSKAALNHLTQLLAKQVGPEVRVNAVAPGLIETPWTADWTAQHEAISRSAPLRRTGRPEDVAHAAVALLTNGYTTGAVLLVDGGVGLTA